MKILRHLIPPVFSLIVGLITFGYYSVLSAPREQDKLVPDEVPIPASIEKPNSQDLTLESVPINESAILEAKERPLFSSNRRKPEPILEEVFVEPEPEPIPEPKIVEVVPEPIKEPVARYLGLVEANGVRSALIGFEGDEKWYKIGDFLGEWRIKSITRDNVGLVFKNVDFSIFTEN